MPSHRDLYVVRLVAATLLLTTAAAFGAREHCPQTTSFSPVPGVTHQAAYLMDPAGEQVAVFDLSWGGVLVSLRYNDVEYVSSSSTNGGFRCCSTRATTTLRSAETN